MKTSHVLLLLIIVLSILLFSNLITAQKPGSCSPSACGNYIAGNSCQCDAASLDPNFNDYCTNIQAICPKVYEEAKKTGQQLIGPALSASCDGKCGGQASSGCWCDDQCSTYGDCCSDYQSVCKDVPTSYKAPKAPLKLYKDSKYKGPEYFNSAYGTTLNYIPVVGKVDNLKSVQECSKDNMCLNDEISSFQLDSGYVAIIFKNDDFLKKECDIIKCDTTYQVFYDSVSDLSNVATVFCHGSWNDCITSVKVCKVGDIVCSGNIDIGTSIASTKFACNVCEFDQTSKKWLCEGCIA